MNMQNQRLPFGARCMVPLTTLHTTTWYTELVHKRCPMLSRVPDILSTSWGSTTASRVPPSITEVCIVMRRKRRRVCSASFIFETHSCTKHAHVHKLHEEWQFLISNTPFTRYSRLSNRLCNRFDNRLHRVNKIQPILKPVVKPVWQPVGCLYAPYNLLSNRLSNRFWQPV